MQGSGTSGFLPRPGDRVAEVMRRWPQTIHVFLRHRMACVGCSFDAFHTVAYAAEEHGVGLARLLRELRRAAAFGLAEPLAQQPGPLRSQEREES
jgi:hybrid cluster-associated redox disulfide protein